jgi:hypothetical protein
MDYNRNSPLLLTATIVPQSLELLQLTDPHKRYRQYIENLIWFITESPFQKFIFCENSLAEIPEKDAIIDLCKFYNKEIEFLSFLWNKDLILKFHRSYGDQEIMEYALDNSKILQGSDVFYKITWRYRVKNIHDVFHSWNAMDNIFIRGWLNKNTVHTAFFKTTPWFFRMHFYGKGLQLLQPFAKKSLERLYYHYIKQSGINMTINWVHPEFSAEWGAGGRMDEYGWRKLKTKIFAKLWVYNIRTTKFQQGDPIFP